MNQSAEKKPVEVPGAGGSHQPDRCCLLFTGVARWRCLMSVPGHVRVPVASAVTARHQIPVRAIGLGVSECNVVYRFSLLGPVVFPFIQTVAELSVISSCSHCIIDVQTTVTVSLWHWRKRKNMKILNKVLRPFFLWWISGWTSQTTMKPKSYQHVFGVWQIYLTQSFVFVPLDVHVCYRPGPVMSLGLKSHPEWWVKLSAFA